MSKSSKGEFPVERKAIQQTVTTCENDSTKCNNYNYIKSEYEKAKIFCGKVDYNTSRIRDSDFTMVKEVR